MSKTKIKIEKLSMILLGSTKLNDKKELQEYCVCQLFGQWRRD